MELDGKVNVSHHTHQVLWIFRTLDPVYALLDITLFWILLSAICYEKFSIS